MNRQFALTQLEGPSQTRVQPLWLRVASSFLLPSVSQASNLLVTNLTRSNTTLGRVGNLQTAVRLLVCLATLCFAAVPLLALDPAKPPGGNFDLSRWKLTLPDSGASEFYPAQITGGFTNSFFYTGADGAMVFACPVTGGTTSGSSYPRSELRELLDPNDDNVNWTGHGTHILNAQCKVTQMPSSQKVIIGQIHSFTGNAYPLIKLQFNNGTVEALVKQSPNSSTDTKLTFANAGLNNAITYQIKVVDGLLSIAVNGATQSVNVFQNDPDWANQTFYFKAGNYCQDNSGSNSEGAVVSFNQLSVSHGGAPTNTPPAPATNLRIVLPGSQPPPVNALPSQILNLSNWKLTLPVDTAHSGSPDEILQTELAGYQHAEYFHRNNTGKGVVFKAHCGGYTTSGSGYPRSELREMTDNGQRLASWSTTSGTHTMVITQAITHLPDVKQHVVAGQIHDAGDDVIVFRLEGTKLFIDENGNNGPVLTTNYQLGDVFTVKFVARNGGVECYYNGNYVYTYAVSTSGCYFKAGCYTQSNTSKGDAPTAYGEVVIYGLSVTDQ